jgi:hypothetical protein
LHFARPKNRHLRRKRSENYAQFSSNKRFLLLHFFIFLSLWLFRRVLVILLLQKSIKFCAQPDQSESRKRFLAHENKPFDRAPFFIFV